MYRYVSIHQTICVPIYHTNLAFVFDTKTSIYIIHIPIYVQDARMSLGQCHDRNLQLIPRNKIVHFIMDCKKILT